MAFIFVVAYTDLGISMIINAIYLLTGAFGGTIIGALGSGSSLATLPILTLIFSSVFNAQYSLKFAVATCMATLVVGSISGARSYIKLGLFDKKLVVSCVPGVILGAIIAPLLANVISPNILKIYIGILILCIAIYNITGGFTRKKDIQKNISPFVLFLVGCICSILSGLAGVALGILMIPFLARYSTHQIALGSNLILAMPYSIICTAGYVFSGIQANVSDVTLAVGFVYLPAFFAISITMAFFPPLGLKLARNINPSLMQKAFYYYLLFAGMSILF